MLRLIRGMSQKVENLQLGSCQIQEINLFWLLLVGLLCLLGLLGLFCFLLKRGRSLSLLFWELMLPSFMTCQSYALQLQSSASPSPSFSSSQFTYLDSINFLLISYFLLFTSFFDSNLNGCCLLVRRGLLCLLPAGESSLSLERLVRNVRLSLQSSADQQKELFLSYSD